MKQVNKNFIYNVIYQVFIFLIPMITTPYISRILGVNNVGIYSYTYSIVYYFMLASMLGINNYGSREIPKCKNKTEVSKKFKSIYFLQLFTNIICECIYAFVILFSKYEYKDIMIIQMLFLISSAFDINWYFFGKEKFKITISRNIIIKLLSMILVFIFVREKNDLWKYTLIMSGSTLISQLYLWIFIKKEIRNVKVSLKDILSNLKPCLILFIPVISYSVYRVMDKTMIGLLSNTFELGNYDSAEKIINIPISFVIALGTVMLPHMSSKNNEEIKKSIYSTFELTSFIIMPMIIGLIIIAPTFSKIFFGEEFVKTGSLIRILSITVVFSSIANVIRTNYLIPQKKDNIYVNSTVLGAIINLVFNSIFIKKYGAYGACIGTILAEFFVMFYQIIFTRKDINYKNVLKCLIHYTTQSLIIGIMLILLTMPIKNSIVQMITLIVLFIISYAVINKKYIYNFFHSEKD